MKFGEKLKVLRLRAEKTQRALADDAQISRRSVVDWENGKSLPKDYNTYVRLARALGCDVADLLSGLEDIKLEQSDRQIRSTLASSAALSAAGVTALLAESPLSVAPIIAAGEAIGAATAFAAVSLAKLAFNSKPVGLTSEQEAAPITLAKEQLVAYQKAHKKFAATITGCICQQFPNKISLMPVEDSSDKRRLSDLVLAFNEGPVVEWWISFVAADEAPEMPNTEAIDAHASALMAQFYDCPPEKTRKVSVVVEDENLYAAFKRKRGNNSYRGNFTAILADVDELSLVREACIATYEGDGEATEDLLFVR